NFYHTMNIYQRKPKGQYIKLLFLFIIWNLFFGVSTAFAIVDPLSTPNNKFGIHIIGASSDEASPAATLVNSSGGDWGYITVLVESKNRNQEIWQKFFNDLRIRHLIPIVRLATGPVADGWKKPYEKEEIAWADFLDNLIWPTKNRYVVIYNEPNHGAEWGGRVDAKSYAQVLDKTITALKNKNPDFFVLNAGLDASTPQKPPNYQDEVSFLTAMNDEVPGIFNKLDGWVSHSYPNPNFSGSPKATGRGTVRTFEWEMQILKNLGLTKNLPIFITETGWKHAEGETPERWLLSTDTLSSYFSEAFQNAWNNNQIVAVTPFLLNYQEELFEHFSFRKPDSKEFYPQYQVIMNLPKIAGKPLQEVKAEFLKGGIYPAIVSGESYTIPFIFKNTGQSIWGESGSFELRAIKGGKELGINPVKLVNKVEPGKEGDFNLVIQSPVSGEFKVILQLFSNGQPLDQKPLEYKVQIKSPVILMVNSNLKWKNNSAGKYLLSIISDVLSASVNVNLNSKGNSDPVEARYLLPDHSFDFTLQRSYYQPKTINTKLKSGVNELNFGTLEPDFFSAILHPKEFWNLTLFSN
ncbi:MAG: hypothetical protein Q7R43_04250, partial [Candidatus Daviesbacteria bacterium]|nr:hypothetical protein [Candidatus Daviesbacteria bacterium]